MVRLFVKPDKEILNIVNKGIEKCNGNLLKFSREVNICRTTIYHWFENRIWIDIKKLKKICDYLDSDYLRLIEGKYVHSSNLIQILPYYSDGFVPMGISLKTVVESRYFKTTKQL